MSKQSEAKNEQNYRETPDSCANCGHYESQIVKKSYQGFGGLSEWTEEKGKRCTIGGFAVKKMATCDRHVLVTPNAGGEARLAAHQPSQTTTATPQGVASTD